MEKEALIVGAGLWGCVVARQLAEAGWRVELLEAREAVGGNSRSFLDPETGVECHAYGAHIFHTSDERVWTFVRRFSEFTPYRHQVLTRYRDKVYFLPIGLPLINAFYGLSLTPAEVPAFIAGEVARSGRDPSAPPRNLEEKALSLVGRPLYEAFIKGYTWKQWNTAPANLPESIINRLPVRSNYDINYYNDPWQGMPADGFGALFDRLLDHPLIHVRCKVDALAGLPPGLPPPPDLPVFYSGAIDRYFGYRFGPLPWRGLRFQWEHRDVPDFQGTAVMNYAEQSVPWTRIHEFRHFHPQRRGCGAAGKTVICYEFPADWREGDEPFYPVGTPDALALYRAYRAEADKLPGIVFGGRLGEYRYYDMDAVIRRALDQADAFLSRAPEACRA